MWQALPSSSSLYEKHYYPLENRLRARRIISPRHTVSATPRPVLARTNSGRQRLPTSPSKPLMCPPPEIRAPSWRGSDAGARAPRETRLQESSGRAPHRSARSPFSGAVAGNYKAQQAAAGGGGGGGTSAGASERASPCASPAHSARSAPAATGAAAGAAGGGEPEPELWSSRSARRSPGCARSWAATSRLDRDSA